jgi:2-oxoglutarate ferredoxin oxidoreductase subunit gamma
MTVHNNGEVGIRLSGTGGQGVILVGIILAEAAIVFDDKNAIQTQTYGPEARGGAVKCEVIISEDDIDYPKVEEPDILLAMSQAAAIKFTPDLKKDGILITDSTFVGEVPEGRYQRFNIPFTQIARDELGKIVVANMVALGALAGITEVVSRMSLEQAVMKRVPTGFQKLNRRALAIGLREATTELVDNPLK